MYNKKFLSKYGSLIEKKSYDAGEKYEKKYKKTGKNTVGDLDDDGTVEDDSHEYAGRKDRAIKTRVSKEEYSNWRSDLSEVYEIIEKPKNEIKIEGKKVKNNKRIKINPKLGESIEEIGGTLLEMVEIKDIKKSFDCLSESGIFFLNDSLIESIVEEVFIEYYEEGYNIFDIENIILESLEICTEILNESNQDDDNETKRNGIGRVKSAVKNVGKKLVRGVGYLSGIPGRGLESIRREFSKGYERGRKGEEDTKPHPKSKGVNPVKGPKRPPSGAGQRERLSSGPYTPPPKPTPKPQQSTPKQSTPKQSSQIPDPWNDKFSSHVSSRNPAPKPQSQQSSTPTSQKPQSQQSSTSPQRSRPRRKSSSKKQDLARQRALRRNPNLTKADLERIGKAASGGSDLLSRMAASAAKHGFNEEYELAEREMTSADKAKESKLKAKYDDSQMKQNMIDQYGKEEGTKIYFATIRKKAMKEEFVDEAKISRTERRERNSNKPKKRSKTMHLVDLDANAMKPKKHGVEAEIEVKKGGKTVRSLNPQEFNKDKKKDDEDYDFNQFRSSKVFKKTLKGNKHVRNLHRGGEASGLTARGGMDNNREVVSHVRNSGFSKKHGVKLKGVHFTGDVPGKGTDDKKMKVIKNLIKAKKPKTIKFSDDHAKNLSAPERFNREEGKDKNKNRGSSTPKIKTYLTRPDGRPVRFGSGGGGVRSSGNVNPPSSNRENQRRRQKARRSMGEAVEKSSDQNSQNNKTQQLEKNSKQQKTKILQQKLRLVQQGNLDVDV